MIRYLVAIRLLWKIPPSSDSTPDAAINLRMETVTTVDPFNQSCLISCCLYPMKIYPAKLLLELFSFKYEASLWSLMIISLAQYCSVADMP